ncbi:hypothetical protein [Actinoplanes sp. URMC 104]|uniref:hypothetical protein n=1 Tax=Actinoplanes sp. URMC 104 TaxID=3423409 RepID=UPI003F1BE56E
MRPRDDGIICPRCHLTEKTTAVRDDGTGRVAPALATLDAHPSPQTAKQLRDMLMQ